MGFAIIPVAGTKIAGGGRIALVLLSAPARMDYYHELLPWIMTLDYYPGADPENSLKEEKIYDHQRL